ncbi:MAG: 16S rRNA (cytosine(1402)-N(4))-methyltransferase [Acidobacteria bacterium]|nr:16S rRNA (cytosine(1402)-N(4))-methyltransferase [Acidobacteriota bacterium]
MPKVRSRLFCVAHHGNFAGILQRSPDRCGHATANIILRDLGVSSMQLDNPDRGFSHQGVWPPRHAQESLRVA